MFTDRLPLPSIACGCLLSGTVLGAAAADAAPSEAPARGRFVDLGVPVTRAAVYKRTLGPDAQGDTTMIYAVFTQNAAPIFLVQIDPVSGTARQFNAARGTHPWGLVVGPDRCLYIGTAGDAAQGGLLLKFDPRRPEDGLVDLGKMADSETYIWSLAAGKGDDCIYGCTYGNGKVVAYNTRTGERRDYGTLRPGQQYTRPIVVGKDGWVYTAAGTTEPDYVALDPRTGEHRSSRPAARTGVPVPELAKGGWGRFRKGTDGHAYQQDGGAWYRLVAGQAEPIAEADLPPAETPALADGRRLVEVTAEGTWRLIHPETGAASEGHFSYTSAGMQPFVIGDGPDGSIYGSTMLPLWLFRTDPRSGRHEVLPNPSRAGGELYSICSLDGILWTFGYPQAYVSSYDPTRPWNFGDGPDHNPRNFGTMGDGHLRPRAVIVGPDRNLYVGSYADYGELGGAMGVFDPRAGKVVESYRHLIRNQSISALAYDPASGMVFGGSDIAGGGGTRPSEKEAVFFVWDPVGKAIRHQGVPVAGNTCTVAMAVAEGKVFVVTAPSQTLSVWDIAEARWLDHRPVPFGGVIPVALGQHSDGQIYGLTRQGILQIDPKTLAVTQPARWPGTVHAGWVMNDDGMTFVSGVRLVRWEWPR